MKLPWKRVPTLGRELDPKLAVLTGEASLQRIKRLEPGRGSTPIPVWEQLPSQPLPRRDYYGVPLLKEPVWIWSVPAYFYVGGVAGGSAVLAAFLHGRSGLEGLARLCRVLAFAGTTVGPGLLTWDLGRKLRFINMLRVFRPSSPMSIGSWTLAGSGALATLALLQGNAPSGRPTAVALGGGGVMLSGYTGVLLANSANPLWQGSRFLLPILFTASAVASTTGLLEMLPLNEREETVVQRFGMIGKMAEAAGMVAMEHQVARNQPAARALRTGTAGVLWKGAKTLLSAGIIAGLLPWGGPWKRRVAGTLTTAGAICLRFALLESGRQAAREPLPSFSP
jgi:formate-dependent nitrite reductase membrane component NrfD